MTARIVVPCSESQSERRHRWRWREHYHSMPGYPVWDRWCERCGRWYIDVLEHKP